MEQTVQSSSHQSEHHFLRILLAAHITQIALFSTSDSIEKLHQIDENVITLSSISEEESENLASLINQLRGKADLPDLQTDNQKLYSYVCSVRACLFHAYIIDKLLSTKRSILKWGCSFHKYFFKMVYIGVFEYGESISAV